MACRGVQKAVSNLSAELEHLPNRMSSVPSIIRSLVDEKPVPMSSDAARRIRKLRHDTGGAAVAYVKCVLPLVQLCISDIKGYFKHYQDLPMDEWRKRIRAITQEVKEHKEVCDTLVAIHEHLMTKLKQQEDDATRFMNERKCLAAKLEEEANAFRNEGRTVVGVGSVFSGTLAFLVSPIGAAVAGAVITTCSLFAAKTKIDQGTKKDEEASKESAAVAVIRDTLLPALRKFINIAQCASEAFAVLQNELEAFQEKGEKAMEGDEPEYIHYKVMNGKAKRIISSCTNSGAEIHSCLSNVDAFTAEELDSDNLEKSLEEVEKFLLMKCTSKKVINKMLKALSIDGELSDGDELTDGDEPTNGDENKNELPKELRALVFVVSIALFANFLMELVSLTFFTFAALCEMEKGELPKELRALVFIAFIALFAYFPAELVSLTLLAFIALCEMEKGEFSKTIFALFFLVFIVLLAYFPNLLLTLILLTFIAQCKVSQGELIFFEFFTLFTLFECFPRSFLTLTLFAFIALWDIEEIELIFFGFIALFVYFPKILFTLNYFAFLVLWQMKQ